MCGTMTTNLCNPVSKERLVWLVVVVQPPTTSDFGDCHVNALCRRLTCTDDVWDSLRFLLQEILEQLGDQKVQISSLRLLACPFNLKSPMKNTWEIALSTVASSQCKLRQQALCISTLGGAHSALGDIHRNHAIKAQELAMRQMAVARAMGNEGLEARCALFVAWALIQQQRVKEANRIVRSLEIGTGLCKGKVQQCSTTCSPTTNVVSHSSRALQEDVQLRDMIVAARSKLESIAHGVS
eukprot:m.13154 g.13154  ORF g.13154 m.13154 type:complete len:240 (-) comp10046_c0_seq1:422-1141(-)